MIIEFEIPKLDVYPSGFPAHWMNVFLLGKRPAAYKAHAIVTTYVRLVEAAYDHYKNARRHAERYWVSHEATSIPIGSVIMSVTYFEDCITSMHRAIECMRRIRRYREVPADIRSLFAVKPQFCADAVVRRIRNMRNDIQHMDDRVIRGDIPTDTWFMLMAGGPETPVDDSDQPNQTLKRIDRIFIGSNEILFSELVGWLKEMGECARIISEYAGENR